VILTKTTISNFMTCEKKYYLSQVIGYQRAAPNKAMFIGTLLHKAKELFSLGTDPAKVLLELKVELGEAFRQGWFDGDMCKTIEAIAYHGAMNAPWPFIEGSEVEKQFMIPMSTLFSTIKWPCEYHAVLLGGKVDEVVLLRDKVQLVDYKTRDSVSGVGTDWFSQVLALDLQQAIYRTAYGKQDDVLVDSFEFRYIKRPGIRQKKGERHDQYLARLALEYSDKKNVDKYYASCIAPGHRVEQVMNNLYRVLKRLAYRLDKQGWEMNPLKCIQYNKACDFLPMCYGDPGWKDLYTEVGPDHHPELELE